MNKKLLRQILKFAIVGGTAFIIDYSILCVCTEFFHIYYLISAIISFTISVIFNYIISVKYVFEIDKEQSKKRNFILFIIFSVIGLGINELIMYIGVDLFIFHYMLVKILATGFVMIYNFITRKLFLEKQIKTHEYNS